MRCAIPPIFLILSLLLGKIPPPFFEHLDSQALIIIVFIPDLQASSKLALNRR